MNVGNMKGVYEFFKEAGRAGLQQILESESLIGLYGKESI